MSNKYSDIINLPHHVSKNHKQMSIESRACQFAPFSALTGYEEEIKETARLTSSRLIIDEDLKIIINNKLKVIQDNIKSKPEVNITYFVPDKRKNGGEYITVTDNVKKIDIINQKIILTNNLKINMNDIIGIHSDIFKI